MYLKSTPDNTNIHWCRYILEYCTQVWGNTVTWQNKKQNVAARSSAEVEYRKRILEETVNACDYVNINQEIQSLFWFPLLFYLVTISIEWIRNKILLHLPKTYTHNTVIEEEE
jgi:hypothetical protein